MIDYGELEGAMVHLELAIRDTRRTLVALAQGTAVSPEKDASLVQ
jgi:hypothetical protein